MRPFTPAAGPAPRTQERVRILLTECIRDGCRQHTTWGLCPGCARRLASDVLPGDNR